MKQRGHTKECKKILNDNKEELKKNVKEKQTLRDNLEKEMNNLKANWSECKGIEAKARKDSKDLSKHLMTRHVQSMVLKKHKIGRS